jgi:hypothetical protein
MRKKGENDVKGAAKAAIPPDENNNFTLGGRKSNTSVWGLPPFAC